MQPRACYVRELHGYRLRGRAQEDAGLVDDVRALRLAGALSGRRPRMPRRRYALIALANVSTRAELPTNLVPAAAIRRPPRCYFLVSAPSNSQ